MSGYSFEATRQPDGSYIMSINGKQYRCTDWADVCRQYHKHTEGATDGNEKGITDLPAHV